MRILVTGGSGFIGTNLIEHYLRHGHPVLNVDIKAPQLKSHDRHWKKVNILDRDHLLEVFAEFKPEYVLHMAARADLRGKSIEEYSVNTTGVENVIHACRQTTSVKKVIFASSMLVCRAGYIPLHDDDYCPPNLYGESKVLGEKIVASQAEALTCEWVIVRPSSIWGPWFGPTYRQFFEMILKRRYFNFAGKMSTKTYGYIGNVVYQIDALLLSQQANGKKFYLGDYLPTDIKEWSKEIAEEIGTSIPTVPRWLIVALAKGGDVLQKLGIRFPMNSFRFKNMTTDNVLPLDGLKALAPASKYSRREGNRLTLQWMKEHYLKGQQ